MKNMLLNTITQDNVVADHIGSDVPCNKLDESNGVSGGQYNPCN